MPELPEIEIIRRSIFKMINNTNLTSSQKKIVDKLLKASYIDESGLRGGNMLQTLSHKLKIKFKKGNTESMKLAREDWSDVKDTSKECRLAEMVYIDKNDGKEYKYQYEGKMSGRSKPRKEPKTGIQISNSNPEKYAECYICGENIEIGSGVNKEGSGYHCEHYLIIGDIGNLLRLSVDMYKEKLQTFIYSDSFENVVQGLGLLDALAKDKKDIFFDHLYSSGRYGQNHLMHHDGLQMHL